jgi:hypothetical protein
MNELLGAEAAGHGPHPHEAGRRLARKCALPHNQLARYALRGAGRHHNGPQLKVIPFVSNSPTRRTAPALNAIRHVGICHRAPSNRRQRSRLASRQPAVLILAPVTAQARAVGGGLSACSRYPRGGAVLLPRAAARRRRRPRPGAGCALHAGAGELGQNRRIPRPDRHVAVQQKPSDWKDTFFPELHAENGD